MNGLILLMGIHPLNGVEIDGWILEYDRSVLVIAVCYAACCLLKVAGRWLLGYIIARRLVTCDSVRRSRVLSGQHGSEGCHVCLRLSLLESHSWGCFCIPKRCLFVLCHMQWFEIKIKQTIYYCFTFTVSNLALKLSDTISFRFTEIN